jgi:hypothetical protein
MDKLKELLNSLKEKGLDITPITLRDIKSKEPSITFTFLVVSGIVALLALFDKSNVSLNLGLNFDNSKELLTVFAALYFGRKVTAGKTTVEKQGE